MKKVIDNTGIDAVPNHYTFELGRCSRGMSENLIAKRMGILPEVYSKLESGTITATKEDVEKLSEILNYPVSFFYQEYTPMELDGNCWSTHQLKEKAIIDQYVPKEVQDRFDALIKRDIKRKREIMWLD